MKIKQGLEQEYAEYKEKNSHHDYSKATVDYAEAWATLMEQRLTNGDKLEDIAEATSDTADTEGITGFMYGAAVWGLARYWEHGEQLRRWHNLHTQISTEGERANEREGAVLNPALLHVEVPSDTSN